MMVVFLILGERASERGVSRTSIVPSFEASNLDRSSVLMACS